MKFQLRVVFLVGSFIGFFIGLLLLVAFKGHRNGTVFFPESLPSFEQWLRSEHLQMLKKPSAESVSTAQYLYDRVRISCVVFSSKQRQARAVVGTWGRHCNSLSFVADFDDKYVPVDLRTSLEDPHIVCKTLHRLVEHDFVANANQWLFLTDDTTFAVVENLRYLVAPLNTSDVYYLGHAVRKPTLRGAGQILNVLNGGKESSDCSNSSTEYVFIRLLSAADRGDRVDKHRNICRHRLEPRCNTRDSPGAGP